MNDTCPNCGYCKHCGRGANPYQPIPPLAPYRDTAPYWYKLREYWYSPTTTSPFTSGYLTTSCVVN